MRSSTTSEIQEQASPEEMAAEDQKVKAQQGRARRAGVAAESVDATKIQDYKKPVYPKDAKSVDLISNTLKNNDKMQVLVGHLTGEPLRDVINAFYSKDVAQGADIIKQGGEGDCLYIIYEGEVDIFVARPGPDGNIAEGDKGSKVAAFGVGSLFGEVALLYNTPRAATVTAVSPVKVWVLDATDFKMLLAQSSQAQYTKYEGWLSQVELLKSLNHVELSKLAEVMETELFDAGEAIVKQGDAGEKFYILEDGEAAAFITGPDGEKEVKKYEQQGEYFGEIALLNSEPRKATVRAVGRGCAVVGVSKEDFTNILGPLVDRLQKDAANYPQYADILK